MVVNKKRIVFSNKIYPLFAGLSGDLIFYVTINTLFLTEVKKFSALEISSLTTISLLVMIILNPLVIKIINKIGALNSVKVGVMLLFLGAFLITVGNNYFTILIGSILYEAYAYFKKMDTIILRNNLSFLNEKDKYLEYESKGSLVFAVVTMLPALISGFLFNLNPYLPMIGCLIFCVINLFLVNFLYEVKTPNEKVIKKDIRKVKITHLVFLLLLLFAVCYSIIDLGQSNSKLFIQYKLNSFLSLENVSIILTIIISVSKIVRVLANYFFLTIYEKYKSKVLSIIGYSLLISFTLILIGNFLPFKMFGIILMSIGFCVFLAIRDPFDNYIKELLLDNTNPSDHEVMMNKLNFTRKIGKLIISSLITLILLKDNLTYVMVFLLGLSCFSLVMVYEIYKILKKKKYA
ncbi:MAG TPA: hypothetical protein IAB59_06365 [Candidatus Onthousia faecipullorum]|uniref:MFS transporter n=1 Tax=Candidatus Onthousia faecipullorum TaxID=2840887 RepID=A0A9D1KBW9_9FIRM|nr:hypothetical protein [Candidatus Onthousia faecipullorum]